MQNQPPFQFSVRRLFALTTTVAISVSVAWSFDAPDLARGGLAVYFLWQGAWSVLALAEMRRFHERKRRLAEQRAELAKAYGGPARTGDVTPADNEPPLTP